MTVRSVCSHGGEPVVADVVEEDEAVHGPHLTERVDERDVGPGAVGGQGALAIGTLAMTHIADADGVKERMSIVKDVRAQAKTRKREN
jgi:hypothetical protein